MSDTPLTEAMIDLCGDYEKAYHYNGRFAAFARRLERDRAELIEALLKYHNAVSNKEFDDASDNALAVLARLEKE